MFKKLKDLIYETCLFLFPYFIIGILGFTIVTMILNAIIKASTNESSGSPALHTRQCKQLTYNQNATYLGKSTNNNYYVRASTIFCRVPITGVDNGYQLRTFEIQEEEELDQEQ